MLLINIFTTFDFKHQVGHYIQSRGVFWWNDGNLQARIPFARLVIIHVIDHPNSSLIILPSLVSSYSSYFYSPLAIEGHVDVLHVVIMTKAPSKVNFLTFLLQIFAMTFLRNIFNECSTRTSE